MKRIGTSRRKTRSKFTKHIRERGKISLTRFLQSFQDGDRVKLLVEPSYQKGMYHPRFYGKTGVVGRKRGKCYEVRIKDYSKDKIILVHPVHLKRL